MYSRLKKYIIFAIILVLVGFMIYSEYMMNHLEQEIKTSSRIYGRFIRGVGEMETELDIIFDEVVQNIAFPVVVTDNEANIIAVRNIEQGMEEEILQKLMRIRDPVVIEYENIPLGRVYYGDTKAISFLRWAPFFQITLALLLLAVGIYWFRGARKTEQEMIWTGIAKETAHQLGTPLSSLLAWTEYIKDVDIKKEMMKDIEKLEEVSERFSSIGSISFKETEINTILANSVAYIEKRIPNLENRVNILEDYGKVSLLKMDQGLISWAIENILKNSVDAGARKIEISSEQLSRHIRISVKDNGRGIGKKDVQRIFDPGFTTKECGWGMGLSLVRRIVDLHKGKIYCSSKEKSGTTFIIQLPLGRDRRRA